MSAQARCHCQSCTVCGLTGPAIVITIGVLFLLHQTHGGNLDFGRTWPMILVVIGFLHLGSAFASREGHIGSDSAVPPANPGPPSPPQTPYANPGR